MPLKILAACCLNWDHFRGPLHLRPPQIVELKCRYEIPCEVSADSHDRIEWQCSQARSKCVSISDNAALGRGTRTKEKNCHIELSSQLGCYRSRFLKEACSGHEAEATEVKLETNVDRPDV